MAFHLISSNRVERLQHALSALLQAEPLTNPLMPETVLIPSMPMQRWLGLQLAEHAGIHCNVDYALPASWIWRLVSGGLITTVKPDPLARAPAAWLIFRLLPTLLDQPKFTTLQQYLSHDPDGMRRWQLCSRIADVFDRYQYYRPDMIRSWSSGDGDGWQPILWRSLLTHVGMQSHRVALIDRWLACGAAPLLPPRIVLFCIAALPPLLLQLLQQVARQREVYLYYLTPTEHYWADLKTEKSQAKNSSVYSEVGHTLLASWGRQGQCYQSMLLDHDTVETVDLELCEQHWPATRLGNLQRDIFALQTEPPEPVDDHSIEIHLCHSAQRECQILHDALLQRLEDDPSLKPEEILVMVPEISRYAPYIATVFTKESSARAFIPWNISDISIADDHPLVAAFLQLLQLPHSRFAYSEVVSLLDVAEIRARFSLDNAEVETIRDLLDKLHVRWGIDADHRQQLGLPASANNSWKQAEQRFLMGYAMGEGALWQGIAPLEVGSNAVDAMTKFWALFERLNHWRQQLQQPRAATAWQADLTIMVEDFFSGHSDDGARVQQIRDLLADFGQQAGDNTIAALLVCDWLKSQLAQQDIPNRYFSGGVSFCGMRPMRSLPFRVICLLGMQDAAFPSREHPVEFDLMANQRQAGDPHHGEADRYLMLETLLCARDILYISYTGRSIRDNSVCQPSVLVGELRDELVRCYGEEAIEKITHLHPMQPFSARNFTRHGAHDGYWCTLANAVADPTAPNLTSWPTHCITGVELPSEIPLARLIQFAKHPVKFFVNHTLNIYLNHEDEICDDEPFTLDALQSWHLRDRLLQAAMLHDNQANERLKAEGLLPHGAFADQALQESSRQITPLREALLAAGETEPQLQSVEIICGNNAVRLCGEVAEYYPGLGVLQLSPSKVKGKHLLATWIAHLALCAAGKLDKGEVSRLVGVNQTVTLQPLADDDALHQLSLLIDGYGQGLQQPLPIFPAASWAYASTKSKTSDPYKASIAAQQQWRGFKETGDINDPYIKLIIYNMDGNPIENSDFKMWAQRLYAPLLLAAG
ncbi:MAG: exodeoxyribonuclease V subunit gamma [Mariprofundales bacterium]